MRYMLLLHGREEDVHATSPTRVEEIAAFLARFEDELTSDSELDWSEVLGSEVGAVVVNPGGSARESWFNTNGQPLERVWVVRVPDAERAREIAARLAAGVESPVEVRECLPSAQRP